MFDDNFDGTYALSVAPVRTGIFVIEVHNTEAGEGKSIVDVAFGQLSQMFVTTLATMNRRSAKELFDQLEKVGERNLALAAVLPSSKAFRCKECRRNYRSQVRFAC